MIKIKKVKKYKIILEGFRSVISYRRSYPRILTDESISQILPQLDGSLIDLGSSKKTTKLYKKLNSKLEYISTNISGEYDKYLDMQKMDLPSDSVDNFLSIFSLEHLPHPQQAIDEIRRTLKPGKNLILVAPFMVRRHCLPDYYRFGYDSLKELHKDFNQVNIYRIGDFDLQLVHYFYPRLKFWPILFLLMVYKLIKSLILQDFEFEETSGKTGEGFSSVHPFAYLVIAKK